MKETIVDVLMYLFESYMDNEPSIEHNLESMQTQLLDAGFQSTDIEKAFEWLEDLGERTADTEQNPKPSPTSTRIYHSTEHIKLDRECQGFLLFLEQNCILTSGSREIVIDRIMALETDEIDLQQLKWIVLMVLFNRPDGEASYTWLENLVLDGTPANLH